MQAPNQRIARLGSRLHLVLGRGPDAQALPGRVRVKLAEPAPSSQRGAAMTTG